MKCLESLQNLRDDLHKQIDEESLADMHYDGVAKVLADGGLGYLSQVVKSISLDERKHHLLLRGLVDALTEECRD